MELCVLGGGRSNDLPVVKILGRFRVELGDRALAFPLQAQRVIAYLAVTGTNERRDRLAGRLWPFSPKHRADANLRTALWRIGSTTDALVDATRSHVALRSDVLVDSRAACTRARSLVDGSSDEVSVPRDMWQDELLPGWDEDWLTIERERLRQLRIHALESLSRLCTARGSYLDAIDIALTVVSMEPLRESAQIVLMEAYLAEGNVSEAHRQLSSYQSLLRAELGIEPSQRIIQLIAS